MRRPSREPSGSGGPQWDDPNGQLPGTGIPGDSGDSLYRSSSLRRRRDASPVRGTVESVGQEGVGVVPERPSLFSTSGSSSFNPFSAALSSLRPEERAEVNRTGVSDALQRYANQEMQRLFAEHLRSLPQEPVSSSFDPLGFSSRVMSAGGAAQGSGVAGGTAQVFHIGTPSGSENTATEGQGSSLFQSIPSQRSSIPSHPTSSPVSFGPSTPVMSASAAPAGLLSSPGGMSDVGGTLTPPGLPLSDPPRVSGSYGIPSSDPVFGMSSGSLPCENAGQVPRPAQAPVAPPPPPQGVGDPFAQILVGQSAMSQLMLQMAQEMQRRAMGDAGMSQHGMMGQGNNPGISSGDSRKEMRMDEKWIPAMPTASWKTWTSRSHELAGFKGWLEQFSGWLCLIHDAYGPAFQEP